MRSDWIGYLNITATHSVRNSELEFAHLHWNSNFSRVRRLSAYEPNPLPNEPAVI